MPEHPPDRGPAPTSTPPPAGERLELPQGTLELLTLQVLAAEPLHGYEVARRLHLLSADVLRVEEGSLYPALHRLERQGLIKGAWGTSSTKRRVRVYRATAAGRRDLAARRSRWSTLCGAVESVLREGASGA
ncbi:MAG: PadR family transcriptional regulator [Planctomycetota bacterium]